MIKADQTACFAIGARSGVVSRSVRMETLESSEPVFGRDGGCEDQEVVVGC